jgi:hypothetical protein
MHRPGLPLALIEMLTRFFGAGVMRDFSQVAGVLACRPYDAIVDQWRQRAEVEDLTDPNYDVSFAYAVGPLVVRLSMVGPYALVLRQERELWVTVESPAADTSFVSESLIAEGFMILRRDLLNTRVDIWPEEGDELVVYNCLFDDGGEVPWRQHTS